MRWAATAFAMLLAVFLLVRCQTETGILMLVNHASEPISHATILVCRQTIEIGHLPPGERKAVGFEVRGESSVEVNVTLQSGKTLSETDGYVSSGFDYFIEIEVTDHNVSLADIQLVQSGGQ